MTVFSPDELRRYSRHLLLPDFGVRGQKRLKEARVLVVGAGGLGAPASLYLAAAGVGTLGLVDFDVVDVSNLQRQIIHGTASIGQPKVDSARARLADLNPTITLRTHQERLTSENALALFADYDLVLDGTDTFATRYLINDACFLSGKPNVSASVFRFEGQLSIFCAKGGPCYRCLYPEPPPPGLVPSCGEGGVLGVVPGVIGTLQATEAIKFLAGIGEPLVGRLLVWDALAARFQQLKVKRDPTCPLCGDAPSQTSLIDYDAFCGVRVPEVPEVDATWVRAQRPALLDVREPGELEIDALPGARHIPLGQLEQRFQELRSDEALVVFCRVGERSARAVELLRRIGFERVYNLAGGLERWRNEE